MDKRLDIMTVVGFVVSNLPSKKAGRTKVRPAF
jgi:hypothetical protein